MPITRTLRIIYLLLGLYKLNIELRIVCLLLRLYKLIHLNNYKALRIVCLLLGLYIRASAQSK
jgi:hypothetical protein